MNSKERYLEFLKKAPKYESAFRKHLEKIVSFPTVAFRDYKEIADCAEYIKNLFDSYGYEAKIYPTAKDGHPVVFAEKNMQAKKTLMFYHHYDVQPEDPIDLWESSPWTLTERNDRLFGRGTVDDKGELILSLIAMQMLEDEYGEMPINIKFVMEGEEEAGSNNLPLFAEKHTDLLKADGCIWEGASICSIKDDYTKFENPIYLICGVKGCAYFHVTSAGPPSFPRTDVHSGEAAATPNAAWRLVWFLNSLKDDKENILIDGFNDLIFTPDEMDIKALEGVGESFEKNFKIDYLLDHLLLDRKGLDLATELYLKPSLSICGLKSGSSEDDSSKTIVPSSALAKLDFRLVPNLTMDKVQDLLTKHMKKHGFTDFNIKMVTGYNPAKTPLTHPFIQAIRVVSEEITDSLPVQYMPIAAGSGPAYLFTPYTPICLAANHVENTNGHAPNENFPISCLNSSLAYNVVIAEKMIEK
ncbi:MAG: M20/M25/M40 family metallo-hydrolase [Asgard group archaeon]|nr:M20/M25/M40 family metallo-hydrolase [Asgard group archaeon]